MTHNLVVLAEKTSPEFQESVRIYFVDMNRFPLHGRYPDPDRPLPGHREAEAYVRRAEETLAWLIQW